MPGDIAELLANGIKQPMDPIQSMAQVQSLRNMMQENAMNSERLTSARLANTQAQLAANRDQQFRDLVAGRMQQQQQTAPPSDAGIPASGPAAIMPPPALAPGSGRAFSRPMTMPGTDYESLAQAADAAGLPDRATELRKAGAGIAEQRSVATKNVAEGSHFDAETAKMHAEAVGQASGSLVNLPDDQAAALWPSIRAGLIAQGHVGPNDIPAQYPGKIPLQQMHDAVMDATQQVTTHLAKIKSADDAAAAAAALPATVAKSEMETAVAYAQAHPEDADAQQKALTAQQRFEFADKAATQAETAKRDAQTAKYQGQEIGLRGAALSEEKRLHDMQYENVKLDGPALDKVATMFATTGQMPQLGMGAAAATNRTAIIKRATEMYPNVDFASNAAAYAANKNSLKAATAMRDNVNAFAQTAMGNLQLFEDAAKKLPDTGVPWLNLPVRMLNQKLVGDKNMAVVNAGRQVAFTEIAKIQNSPNLQGALSDSARHEVMGLSPENATIPQILAVSKLVKSEMTNRQGSLDGEVKAISDRIGINPGAFGGAGGTPAPAPAAPVTYKQTATGPNSHKIGSNDGGKTWFDVQTNKEVK